MRTVEVPVLSEREQKIFKAMKSLEKELHFSRVTVVDMFRKYRNPEWYLWNNYKDPLKKSDRKQFDSYCAKVEGLQEAFESFQRFNSSYQENIIIAYLIDKYVYQCAFETGDIVFSSELGLLGFAGEIIADRFSLYSGNARRESQLIGLYEIRSFVKVRLTK